MSYNKDYFWVYTRVPLFEFEGNYQRGYTVKPQPQELPPLLSLQHRQHNHNTIAIGTHTVAAAEGRGQKVLGEEEIHDIGTA